MSLYIKIENGRAVDHPALEENLMKVYGAIPSNYEPFVRGEKPISDEPDDRTFKKIIDHVGYEKVDGTWTDTYGTVGYQKND
jgi:hypothetical protein